MSNTIRSEISRFPTRYLRADELNGAWRGVALVKADVSEESVAFIIRVTRSLLVFLRSVLSLLVILMMDALLSPETPVLNSCRPSHLSETHFNIISNICLCLPSVLPIWFSHQNPIIIHLIPHVCYVRCHSLFLELNILPWISSREEPPLCLLTQRSWVRFPVLPNFLRSSGSGTGSTQPREDKWGATWKKSSGSGQENRH
jgi:hypothetical protein